MSYRSYIAGLNLTEPQALNGLAWAATAGSFYLSWPGSDFKNKVEQKAGKVAHMPADKKGSVVTMTHALALFAPATAFLVSLPVNRFILPGWLSRFALPPAPPEIYYGARIGGCIGALGAGAIMVSTFKHLSAQWHFIGVRERPEIVNTGPYRVVRHPMYSCAMLLEVCFAGAFWNWISLPALGAMVIAFAIKMPIEEQLILDHEKIGKEYKEYKKQVPSRVIPYLW